MAFLKCIVSFKLPAGVRETNTNVIVIDQVSSDGTGDGESDRVLNTFCRQA